MWRGFLNFLAQGHALQLAIGVIIAGAFEQIINGMVSYIIIPILGYFSGGVRLNDLVFHLGDNVIQYGAFIETILNFVIVAASIFIFIKVYDRFENQNLISKLHLVSAEPEEIKEMVGLLEEIRGELREANGKSRDDQN